MRKISIEIGPGELADRLTILELKWRHAESSAQRERIGGEHARISRAWQDMDLSSSVVKTALEDLRSINGALWKIEDDLRRCEADGDFGPRFVELARAVYLHNDRRAAHKRTIDAQAGSPVREEKIYPSVSARGSRSRGGELIGAAGGIEHHGRDIATRNASRRKS